MKLVELSEKEEGISEIIINDLKTNRTKLSDLRSVTNLDLT
jgi:hypothetical protein